MVNQFDYKKKVSVKEYNPLRFESINVFIFIFHYYNIPILL